MRLTIAMNPAALDQGTATLIAAIVAAVASVVTSLVVALPQWLAVRRRKARLISLLSGDDQIRSLEWLARRMGVTQAEVSNMLSDVKAHGVLMANGKEGAALDSRHRGD